MDNLGIREKKSESVYYLSARVNVCIHTHIYIHICIYMCVYICIHIYVYVKQQPKCPNYSYIYRDC